mgnify:CR=1 FL=1
MVAQNKDDFLFQLHNELHRIGVDADEEIFADFEEHFKESSMEGLSEEETCRRLGDVKEIARSYINIESSRLNSIVAQAIESDRPHVSLTKPGRDVPADLSLVKDKREADMQEPAAESTDAPLREYTPEHISEEIYPESKSASVDLSKGMETPESSAQTAENTSAQDTNNAEPAGTQNNNNSNNNDTVAGAFAAAGAAAASAARSAGHAIAEAFGSESMKDAGRNAAEAIKTAGHATAEAIRTAAENAKNEHKAQNDDVPHPSDSFRENKSDDRECHIPPQSGQTINTGKGFKFADLKGMKMNPNFGKLFGAIIMDVALWSWLLSMLVGIAISIITSGLGVVGSGCGIIFSGSYFFISNLFLGIALISLGVIIFMLGILLVKGIVNMIKKIVIMHVKALYDL